MGSNFQKETPIPPRLIINRNGVVEFTLGIDCSLTVAHLRTILTERLPDLSKNEEFIHSNGAPIRILDENEMIISELLLKDSNIIFIKTRPMKELSKSPKAANISPHNRTDSPSCLQSEVLQKQQQISSRSSTVLSLVPVTDTIIIKTESGTKSMRLSEILSGTKLEIKKEMFSVTDMKQIISALKQNKTVKEVSIQYACGHVVEVLAEVLKVNQTLTVLDITYEMNDADCILVANALIINRTLRDLKLTRNHITSKGCQAIAEMLKFNKTLAYLNICRNKLRDEGVKFICEALMINKTLRRLDIYQTQMSTSGCSLVAEMLRTNRTLTLVDIGDNNIGDNGIIMIADALKYNDTLIELDSKWNKITERGALALIDTLKTNRSIRTVKLQFNNLSQEEEVAINQKAPQLKTTGLGICSIS